MFNLIVYHSERYIKLQNNYIFITLTLMGVIYLKNYPTKKKLNGPFANALLIFSEIILIVFLFNFASGISQEEKKTPLALKQNSSPVVLGEKTEIITPSPSPIPTLIPTSTPFPLPTIAITPTQIPTPSPAKKEYSIAIIGDSMVDTMGERLEYLEKELKNRYPQTNFTLYNYGIGSETVEMGINRLDKEFRYQDRSYTSLTNLKPDILIVASFAYNPFFPYDRNRHWLMLASLIEKAKTLSPQIYTLAEIAPLGKNFGQGPNGVNWSEDTALTHAQRIIEQLENIVGLSNNLNVKLIDAFHPSQNGSSKFGKQQYVNSSDGIHPSVAGHQFMAEKIAGTIELK